MKNSLILILLFACITAFSQPITLKWQKRSLGITWTGQKTFDETYGFGESKVNSWKFGVDDGSQVLQGAQAYAFLSSPTWGPDDKPFKDILPVIYPLPPGKLPTGDYWKAYPDTIPPFREKYYVARKPGPIEGSYVQYNLYLRSEADLFIWDYFEVEEWVNEFPLKTVYVDNPAYFEMIVLNEQQRINYVEMLKNELTLMGYFPFPKIPDDEGWRWYQKIEGQWVEIPVVQGKFADKNKWVPVYDLGHMRYDAFMKSTILIKDKDKRVKTLIGIK